MFSSQKVRRTSFDVQISVKFWGCIQHYPKRELNKFYLFIFDSVLAADFVSIVQGYTDFFNLKIIFVF